MGLGIMGRNLPPLRAAGEGTTSGACLYAPGPVTGLGRPCWGVLGKGGGGRVIRSAPKRLPLGDSRVYGQESCPQPENDHREDEKNSPYKPEGSFGERHKARRCRPSPISRTQGATRNRKSARRKMILRSSLGGTGCSKWQTKMLQDFSGV